MSSFNRYVSRKGTNAYKWEALKKFPNQDSIIPLSVADSEYPSPTCIKKALKKRVNHGIFGYTVVSDAYKESVQNWFYREYHYHVQKEWIVPINGVVNAMSFAIHLFTNELDPVVVQPPVYPPFFRVVERNNRTLIKNPLLNNKEHYSIDFKGLEKIFQEGGKMLLFCSPHNPVGRVYTEQEVEKVVMLCKKYNVILVSDEIHCDLVIRDLTFVSAGSFFEQYDNIILCTAPSKTFNIAGMHAGNVLIANEKLRVLYETFLKNHSLYGMNVFSLVATEVAYTKCYQWIENQRKHIRKNFDTLDAFFQTYLPKATYSIVEGTYLAWINMRYLGKSCKELFDGLIEHGVYVNCGNDYCSDYEGYIRINMACPTKMLNEGLRRIKNYVDSIEQIK